MLRASLLWVAVLAALLALAAAQEDKQQQQQQQQHAPEEARPAAPASPLTAMHLPSESLFRAARTAVRAARALADNMPSSLNLSTNMVQTLAVAGAVVVGLLGSAAVLAIVLPMFGFRLCYLFGTCDSYAHAYLAPSAYDAYAYSQPVYASAAYAKSYDGATNELPYSYEGYPQHTAQVATYPTTNSVAANAYQKRSLEYVGPILKMLSNAYEKYNHLPAQAKAIVESQSVADTGAEASDPKSH